METTLRFIRSSAYDFTDDAGKRVQGVSCQCFDEASQKIVKVKTDEVLNYNFGDPITVLVELNGEHANYIAV